MAAPFDDQNILDIRESLTYVSGATTDDWKNCTLDDQGMQTVFAGTLSLVFRDVMVTVSRSEVTYRPATGATLQDADNTIYKIVSALNRKLGYFWEVTARTFNVPGGLDDTGTLARRVSTSNTPEGLNQPTWTAYATNAACKFIPGEQAADTAGETAVDTLISGRAVFAGFYEMRAGDRYTDSDGEDWNVDSVEPYDPSLGATAFSVSRRM